MRIVFYSVSTTLYGAPTSLLNLIQGLVKYYPATEIIVVVPSSGPLTVELSKLPVRIIRLRFYKWVYNQALYNKKKQANAPVAKLWFVKNYLSKLLLNLCWLPLHLLRVNLIKPDLIYTNSSLSPMGVIVARILKIRSLWHHRETINDPETNFFTEWSRGLTSRVLNWPAIHLHPSVYLKMTYEPYVSSGKSYVVYNGVAMPETFMKKSIGENQPLVFGMVGRINTQKGQHEVIDSLDGLDASKISLNIYGSGEKYYVDRMKVAAPQNVHFRGFQPKEAMYREIDFLIINARNESFGRVVAEAYAYGVPVIALNSGALPELVDHGVTGFIYDDKESLRTLMTKGLTLKNEPNYSGMIAACLQKFNANFTISIYSVNIFKILAAVHK